MQELFSGVFVIRGSTNIGVITTGSKDNPKQILIYLVDSGASEIDGEYILDALNKHFSNQNKSYKIVAILSTHCHPDHVGGHIFIKEKTMCEIWATHEAKAGMEVPIIQSEYLWGGYPPRELRGLFFKPNQTFVDKVITEDDVVELSDNRKITFMYMKGHSKCSVNIIVSQNDDETPCNNGNFSFDTKKIVFSGDSIFPREQIIKFWIPLIENPDEFMHSLDKLCELKNVQWCIPSHGEFINQTIEETAELNKVAIISTKTCILDALEKNGKMTVEEIVKYVADKNLYKMNFGQYQLILSTIRSYIATLHDSRKIKLRVEENTLFISLA